MVLTVNQEVVELARSRLQGVNWIPYPSIDGGAIYSIEWYDDGLFDGSPHYALYRCNANNMHWRDYLGHAAGRYMYTDPFTQLLLGALQIRNRIMHPEFQLSDNEIAEQLKGFDDELLESIRSLCSSQPSRPSQDIFKEALVKAYTSWFERFLNKVVSEGNIMPTVSSQLPWGPNSTINISIRT